MRVIVMTNIITPIIEGDGEREVEPMCKIVT